jgi:hypothetical protein
MNQIRKKSGTAISMMNKKHDFAIMISIYTPLLRLMVVSGTDASASAKSLSYQVLVIPT